MYDLLHKLILTLFLQGAYVNIDDLIRAGCVFLPHSSPPDMMSKLLSTKTVFKMLICSI